MSLEMKLSPEALRLCSDMELVRKLVKRVEVYSIDGAALRKERKALGITQRNLAKLIGVSAPFLNDLEFSRRNCSDKVLSKILEVFKKARAQKEQA